MGASKRNDSTISVTYEENTSASERTATITAKGVSTSGGFDPMVISTVTQAGASSYIVISPDTKSVGTSAGTTTFSLSTNVSWSITEDADWLTVTRTDGSTIDASFDANATINSRSAHIAVTGTGGLADTVVLTQYGESILFDISPDSIRVSAESGETTFSVSTNVEAMEWSIDEDVSWLTAVRTDDGIISISYEANPWTGPRSASIKAFVIQADVSRTVTITQDGAAAYLDVSPDTISVGSEAGSTTFTVMSNIEWLMSEEAEWLSLDRSNDTLVTVNYEENPDAEDRTAIITLSGEGVSSQNVVIEQSGIAVGTMIDLSDHTHITLYPNPSSDKVCMRTASDIHAETMITLYDDSGKILYAGSFEQILSREIIEIDLSGFHHGIYILQLRNSKSVVTEKIIKY